jgi:ABC-2 type transport system ATP-binding protein
VSYSSSGAPSPFQGGSGAPAIEISGLRKVYKAPKGGQVVAVDDVSFSVARGEVVGLLGSNGAGKTTTLKCLCSLIRPTAGRMSVAGLDVQTDTREALRRLAAVLEGTRNIYWRLTVRENLTFFAGLHGISRGKAKPHVERLIDLLRLRDKADTLTSNLSRGMLQKLGIACALIKQTEVLLLDEPTLGLDVETTYELRGILREMAHDGTRTLLLSSHDMHVVQEVCDRVIIINRGRVVMDDRVSNVLELFATRAYEFRLEERLEPAQEQMLRALFPGARLRGGTHESILEVELEDGHHLYRVIDALRDQGASIRTVERRTPNLEQAFLSIIRETMVAA